MPERARSAIVVTFAIARQALASSPSTNALATLTDSWRVMRSKLAAWNDTLTRRAIECEGRDL